MEIRPPGLEITEPLKPRPLRGAALGAATGLLVGLIGANDSLIGIKGCVLGGVAGGATIGMLAPFLRRRWTAGLVATAGATVGLLIAYPAFRDKFGALGVVFLGVCAGLVYAVMFCDYRRPSTEERSDAPPS